MPKRSHGETYIININGKKLEAVRKTRRTSQRGNVRGKEAREKRKENPLKEKKENTYLGRTKRWKRKQDVKRQD